MPREFGQNDRMGSVMKKALWNLFVLDQTLGVSKSG
jgi:hypothetical protein